MFENRFRVINNMTEESVQILKYNRSRKLFELDVPVLEGILLADDIKDLDIVVISIAGALRRGKSFMLSFFLRYLRATDTTNWLGDEETALSGFSWRGGSQRHTAGIWIWSKIFKKQLPNGQMIAIMLMDTQGTFDSNSTMKDNVTIFSLCTMISSIQIYNIFHNIQQDDLQHLQLFTEYGKLAMEHSGEKAFQRLLFLIRDWNYPYEAAYGFDGGKQILDQNLEVTDDQDEELVLLRTHIKSCYENISCFLMPYPGRIAAISQYFTGQLKDIDESFKNSLKEFVPSLFLPENLLIKKIKGENIKAKQLLTYMVSYAAAFNQDHFPTAQTILNVTAETQNFYAKDEANEFYYNTMNQETGTGKPILTDTQVLEHHSRITSQAIELFRRKAILGNEIIRMKYQNKLSDDMQKQLSLFLNINEAKRASDLDQRIIILNNELQKVENENTNQSALLDAARIELQTYKTASEVELQNLRIMVETLRVHVPVPDTANMSYCPGRYH